MKQRIISLLLALCILFAMMAIAEEIEAIPDAIEAAAEDEAFVEEAVDEPDIMLQEEQSETECPHVEAIDPAAAGTCVTVGLSEGSHCELCGAVIVPQEELGYGNHEYADDVCVYCGKTADIRELIIDEFYITLGVKDTYQIEYRFEPAAAEDETVFYSTQPTVAKVDADGKITALKAGTAVIHAVAGECEDSIAVEVKPGIGKITMQTKTAQPEPHEQILLIADYSGYTAGKMKWTSSNSDVAEIEQTLEHEAVVLAKAPGTATVKIEAPNGSSAVCKVTVPDGTKLTGIRFDGYQDTMITGRAYTFNAAVVPGSLKDQIGITWKSSNPKIAAFNKETGELEAKAPGTVTIAATAVQGKVRKTVSVKVRVYDPDQITAVTAKDMGKKTTLYTNASYGTTIVPDPIFLMGRLNDSDYSVVSSDPNVLEAVSTGRGNVTLKAVAPGTAKVTFYATYNGVTKSCVTTVTVKDAAMPEEFSINGPANPRITTNENILFFYTIRVRYYDPANYRGCVTWKSSNPKIAKVDPASGYVTPVKAGTVTITATLNYKGVKKTAKKKLTIVNAAKLYSITLAEKSMEMHAGRRVRVYSIIEPADVDPESLTITYKTSAPKVAVVNENGIVEAKAPGSCVITVTATQGKIKKTAKLKIKVVE